MAPNEPPPSLRALLPPTRQDILDLENDKIEHHTKFGHQPKRFEKRYRTELSTTVASIASIVTSYPLDTIKARLQAYKQRYNNPFDCARQTYRADGAMGFYRGMASPLASITMVRILSMSIYQKSKYRYSEWIYRNFGIDPLVSANTPGEYPNMATLACFSGAGATAGFLVTFISCPFELTKVAAQLSTLMANPRATSVTDPLDKKSAIVAELAKAKASKMPLTKQAEIVSNILKANLSGKQDKHQLTKKERTAMKSAATRVAKADLSKLQARNFGADYANKGVFQTAATIVKNRGLKGIWTGLGLHLLRDTVGTAIYFATYETGKQALNAYRGDAVPTSPISVVSAGALCGITSWALIYPIDTAKTNYQKRCLQSCLGDAVEKERIQWLKREMYKGLGVSVVRSVITSAVFFSVFEAMKRHINALEDHVGDKRDRDLT